MTLALTAADYPAIRTLINATTDDISDTDIASVGVTTFINLLIANVVPDVSLLSATDAKWVNTAAVYYASAYLCPVMLIRFGENSKYKLGDYEEVYQNPDWLSLEVLYLMRARQAWYNLSILVHKNRTLFVTSGPTSSGAIWPTSFQSFYFAIRPKVLNWAVSGGLLSTDINQGRLV